MVTHGYALTFHLNHRFFLVTHEVTHWLRMKIFQKPSLFTYLH